MNKQINNEKKSELNIIDLVIRYQKEYFSDFLLQIKKKTI